MSVNEEPKDKGGEPGQRYSIDLTLELEHQLDNESLPPASPAGMGRPQSLDPTVLASIITQLRMSLTEVSRERDELAQALSEMRAREAGTTDTLAHMTEKCSKLQESLDAANEKSTEDENTISVLRTKVEESRRGLMRLQSESRRASQIPSGLDLSRAGLASFGGPPSSKRASFTPLTGSAVGRASSHRRISSVTDTNFSRFEGGSPHPSSSNPTFLNTPAQQSTTHQPQSSRRISGVFGRASSPPPFLYPSEESAEVEMLRKELNTLKAELDDVKHELSESNEAREASDICVKALRAFIEENNVGAMPSANTSAGMGPSLSRPSTSSQAEAKKATPASGGWGFKLWRAETPAKPIPLTLGMPATPPAPSPPPQPLTRKLGDFFGTRGSISSTTPAKPWRMEQEAMYNGMSDTSSVEESLAEPTSPASELPRPSVLVKDTTSVNSGSSKDLGTSPDGKAGRPPSSSSVEGALTSAVIRVTDERS
ncbi:hypothetical protein F5I97DRAFT_1837551 [Phlebopus sp. FC_14]|nr:hypothetical protein F5I97DRAFT_1837551 [Phlebopus sp. FC_14]